MIHALADIILAIIAAIAIAITIRHRRKLAYTQTRIDELERRNRRLLRALTLAVNENDRLRKRPPIRLPNLSWSTISRN